MWGKIAENWHAVNEDGGSLALFLKGRKGHVFISPDCSCTALGDEMFCSNTAVKRGHSARATAFI